MKLSKDNKDAVLIDIQYVPAKRAEKIPDMLYIIWKDIKTGEKHLETIANPPVNIYFEKEQYRNHNYIKTEEKFEKLTKKTIIYNRMVYEIANELGPEMKNFVNWCFENREYHRLDEVLLSPYVFGADIDIRTQYRNMWLNVYEHEQPKKFTKAFLDIEVDIGDTDGRLDVNRCPIDLVTLIYEETKSVYTYCLMRVPWKERTIDQGYSAFKCREWNEGHANRESTQTYYLDHPEELEREAGEYFQELYPGFSYEVHLYDCKGRTVKEAELELIRDLFDNIHSYKPDFLLTWSSFDIPYIMDRLKYYGVDPTTVIAHPDFINKQVYFKKDRFHFTIKNKTNYMYVTDYTVYVDQMQNYAQIRKGQSELRNNTLGYIAQIEVGDTKLDYSDTSGLDKLSWKDWLKYFLYNIKDVLLQYGIESVTTDIDTYYAYSYLNCTPYEDTFKMTVKLRCLQYRSWEQQGFVPGSNANPYIHRMKMGEEPEDDEDEEDEELPSETKKKKKDVNYEGALVGNPLLNEAFGEELYGKRSSQIFRFSIDMDMKAFYPNTVTVMNIYPPCLIFKAIIPSDQYICALYNPKQGIPFNGITDRQLCRDNNNTFTEDISKEIIDNYVTGDILTFAHKWMNFPSIEQVLEVMEG